MKAKIFTQTEIAEYNATHTTHPKILAAQDKETRAIAKREKRENEAAQRTGYNVPPTSETETQAENDAIEDRVLNQIALDEGNIGNDLADEEK